MVRGSLLRSVVVCVALCAWVSVASCSEQGSKPAQPAAPARTTPAPPRPLPGELKLVYRAILGQRFEQAREMARTYLQTHPRDAQATLMIGLSHFKADNHGAARPYFEEALALDPDYYITHDYLGEALFMLGELEGSRRHYEAFREFVPAEAKTYVRLGMIDLEETQLDQAEEHFRQALERFEALRQRDARIHAAQRPEIAKVHARLADVHFARDDYEAARDELLEATRMAPENISAFFTLSLVYRRLGEDGLANEAAQRYEAARQALIEGQGSATR